MPQLLPTSSDSDMVYTFAIALTVYSFIKKKTAKGKAAALKEEKAIKVKELQFSINNMNYLDFLQSILDKHGLLHGLHNQISSSAHSGVVR